MPNETELTSAFVLDLARMYSSRNSDELYEANIAAGRCGDKRALFELTKWKNSNKHGQPMDFVNHPKKIGVWRYFSKRLPKYLAAGQAELRKDFSSRAPVWSMFWHHVLYRSPIFDVNTRLAYESFAHGRELSRNEARITTGQHWELYDQYCAWFADTLKRLQAADARIDERTLDRALFIWGQRR